jgi:hypothetical protein
MTTSPEELILGGKAPDGSAVLEVEAPVPAVVTAESDMAIDTITDLSKDSFGNPVFADLEQQVRWDWNNLPSERIKQKKNSNSAYAESLLRMLNAAEIRVETPVVPVVTPPVEEVIVPAVAPIVAPAEESDGDDPNLVKTAKGWEYRIDFGDGSGVQVFKGKTQKEVISALGKAQINASKKIRTQEQEKRILIANEPADVDEPQVRLKPRVLTADEQWQISNDLSDPAKATKALDRYIEIRLGGPIEQVVEKVTSHENDLEYRRARNEAEAFIKETPEFYNTEDNRIALATYVESNGWASTKRNLRKAFVLLSDDGKLEQRPSEQVLTPAVEEVSTTSSAVAVELPVSKADASTVSAATPSTQPTSAAPAKPAGLPEGTRVRPGSSSTGMSPRQSSVRTGGAAPAIPVGLTAEEYHRLPTSTIKHKYKSDAVFKTAVDKLIAEGKI